MSARTDGGGSHFPTPRNSSILYRSCIPQTPRSTKKALDQMTLDIGQRDLIPVELGEAWTAFMVAVSKSSARTDYTRLRQWSTVRDVLRKLLRYLTGTQSLADIDAVVSAVMFDVSLAPESVPLRTIVARIQAFAESMRGVQQRTELNGFPTAVVSSTTRIRNQSNIPSNLTVRHLRAIYLEHAGYANYRIDDHAFGAWLYLRDEKGNACLRLHKKKGEMEEWICLGALIKPLDDHPRVWQLKRRNNQLLGRTHRKLQAKIALWGENADYSLLRARINEIERKLGPPRKRLLDAVSNAKDMQDLEARLNELSTSGNDQSKDI